MQALVCSSLALLALSVTAARAEFRVPSCETLSDFPLADVGGVLAYRDQKGVFQQYFGAPLSAWSNEDVTRFRDVMWECKRANPQFQGRYDRNYFLNPRGPVAQAAVQIADARPSAVAQAAADAEGRELLTRVSGLSGRAKDLTLTPEERTQLEGLKSKAGEREKALSSQGARATALSDAARAADEALRTYQSGVNAREAAVLNEQRRAQQAEQGKKDLGLQLLTMFAMVDYCTERKAAFSTTEAAALRADIKSILDSAAVPQADRDRSWSAAQAGLKMAGLEQLPPRTLQSECNGLRTTFTFSFPNIFIAEDPARKNPF